LSESLGQPVVVENQAGASGSIGMNMLKRAAPDGTTIGVVISLAQTIDLIQNKKASFDIGTAHHLYGQVLNKTAGIEMLYVPYKGVTPALNDLLGGHVPAAIVSLAAALPHIQSGQLRLLTVFDTKRYSKLPNVPIISEEV